MFIKPLKPHQYFEKGTNPFLTPSKDNVKNKEDSDEDSNSYSWFYMWDIDENKPPEEEKKIDNIPKHPPSDQPEKKENKKDEGNSLLSNTELPCLFGYIYIYIYILIHLYINIIYKLW